MYEGSWHRYRACNASMCDIALNMLCANDAFPKVLHLLHIYQRKAGFRRVERFGKSGRRDDQFIYAVGKIPTWYPLDFTTGF